MTHLLNNEKCKNRYDAALGDFLKPGERYKNLGRLTYWGKATGMTAEDIIADARAGGATNRDGDIRRFWSKSTAMSSSESSFPIERKPAVRIQPKLPKTAHYVRSLMCGNPAEGNRHWIMECSPCLDWIDQPPSVQTELFLRAAFHSEDKLFIFRKDRPADGKPGKNILTVAEWIERSKNGVLPGDLIVPNPLTGELGMTADGKPSYSAQSCLASFPYLVLEFDDMPLSHQCSFWRGFLLTSKLAKSLVAITYSGGRSLHGLIHVNRKTLAEWTAIRDAMVGLFAAAPEARMAIGADGKSKTFYPYRADTQAMRPRTGTRLPGVTRFGNGKLQELLYLNPAAVR